MNEDKPKKKEFWDQPLRIIPRIQPRRRQPSPTNAIFGVLWTVWLISLVFYALDVLLQEQPFFPSILVVFAVFATVIAFASLKIRGSIFRWM